MIHLPTPAGSPCLDGNVCNGAEACDGAGACLAGSPLVIDDQNLCTADSCDPILGARHTPVAVGTPCSDGNACNGGETCNATGACQPGTPPVVDDQNPCTIDACDAQGGVSHTPAPAGTSCSDANICNGSETCNGAGTCAEGTPPVIDDGNACTTDSCDPIAGVSHTPIAGCVTLPPDPSTVAPPLDTTIATTLARQAEFLYTGNNPIQRGVLPGTINPVRIAVLRGKVLNTAGEPLPGVRVRILAHPELGETLSRADGVFDLAINGGGIVVVDYQREGYISLQRRIDARMQNFAWLPDVRLSAYDSAVTEVDLAAAPSFQMARASIVSDTAGTRQGTFVFPPGVQATMRLADGSSIPLGQAHVRATEFTIGADGKQAMPGDLPIYSGYTYCAEFSVDEAVAAGAQTVLFDRPIYYYLDNYLGFPTGMPVPVGFYERDAASWDAAPNGRVVAMVGESASLAEIDTNGDGAADDAATLAALGVSDGERAQIAARFHAGDTFWRVPISHFSTPDFNWPFTIADDAKPPPDEPEPGPPPPLPDPDCQGGSIIECQNQILREDLPLVGTQESLHYASDRAFGRSIQRVIEIPIVPAPLPASTVGIFVEVNVAGQRFFARPDSRTPGQMHRVVWDGKDAYGRVVNGTQMASVDVSYEYLIFTVGPDVINQNAFGVPTRTVAVTSASRPTAGGRFALTRHFDVPVGTFDARALKLGGMTLSDHHVYDPNGRTLLLGDGTKKRADTLNNVITTVGGAFPTGFQHEGLPLNKAWLGEMRRVAIAPDGTIYWAEGGSVFKAPPGGLVTRVGGYNENEDPPPRDLLESEGQPARGVNFVFVRALTVDKDGNFYAAVDNAEISGGNNTVDHIIRIDPQGLLHVIAGRGKTTWRPSNPSSLKISPDGDLYVAASGVFYQVTAGGDRVNIAGENYGTHPPVENAPFAGVAARVDAFTFAPDGTLYWSDVHKIYRVGRDGILHVFAGNGTDANPTHNDIPAIGALLDPVLEVMAARDGSVYVTEIFGNNFVRRIGPDGVIRRYAGQGRSDTLGEGDGGPASLARFSTWSQGIAQHPDGSIYVLDGKRIRRVGRPLPGYDASAITVASDDGRVLYVFNADGRHLKTYDAITGRTLFDFGYDAQGLITRVTDADGLSTLVERNGSGAASAIVGPYGQRTALALDGLDQLQTLTSPAGQVQGFTHDALGGGLLTALTDAKGQTHNFTYDEFGLLSRDEDPAGGFKVLTRNNKFGVPYEATLTTAEGRTHRYLVEQLQSGDQRRTSTGSDGLTTTTLITTSGQTVVTSPDGTAESWQESGDPRFGMQAPIEATTSTSTPGGLIFRTGQSRSVTLADVDNPLSVAAWSEQNSVNGRIFEQRYDASTRQYTATTPAGRTRLTTLDAQGRVSMITARGLPTIHYQFDNLGRLIEVTQDNRGVAMSYDALGRLSSATDSLSRVTGFEYDDANRLIRKTLADGRVVQMTYDNNDNVTSVTPPGRPAHFFDYTPVDLEQNYTPPSVSGANTVTRYTYNLDQQVTRADRPDGTSVIFDYDAAGRTSVVTTPQGQALYSYDPITGNLKNIVAPGGERADYAYDGALVMSSSVSGTANATTEYLYDNDFRVVGLSINGVAISTFDYDPDGLLIRAEGLSIAREAQSGLIAATQLLNTSDVYTRNAFGETIEYRGTVGSTSAYEVNYTRDGVGRVASKSEIIGGAPTAYAYTYDAMGRLIEVETNGTLTSHYDYDANGNRVRAQVQGDTLDATYDAQDRLLTYGSQRFTYTLNGEVSTKTDARTGAVTAYGYDAFGNLTHVQLPSGEVIDYAIDAFGRRIGKKRNGTLEQAFVYQSQLRPLAEIDGSGNVVSHFVYASQVNVPDSMVKGGATYRFIHDQLGSVRLVIDASSGAVMQRMDYDEFGNVLTDTNPGFQPFGFAGGVYDRDTKLTHFGVREYDAQIGRWTAKDPLRFDAGDSNLYGYVFSDPVNFTDPSGLLVKTTPVVVVAEAAGVATGAIVAGLSAGLAALLYPSEIGPEAFGPWKDAYYPPIPSDDDLGPSPHAGADVGPSPGGDDGPQYTPMPGPGPGPGGDGAPICYKEHRTKKSPSKKPKHEKGKKRKKTDKKGGEKGDERRPYQR